MAIASDTPFDKFLRIKTFGKQERFKEFDLKRVRKLTCMNRVVVVSPPSISAGEGFRKIRKSGVNGSLIKAEGVLLGTVTSAVIIQVGDCPVIVIRNPVTEKVVVTHAGRAALAPELMPDGSLNNIVAMAYQIIIGDCEPSCLQVHITAHICGNCFVHDFPDAEEFIKPFDQFGLGVFTNRELGALDMRAVIVGQLCGLGVLPENITWDNTCTKETPGLSSHRNGDSTRNTIVVELLA